MSKPTHTPGSDWSFDKITQEVTDEHGDMVAIIQWLSSPEIGGIFAAAPDMLEALECHSDFQLNPDVTSLRLPDGIKEKWGERYSQEFPGGELSGMGGFYRLAKLLTEKAIAKAKGDDHRVVR